MDVQKSADLTEKAMQRAVDMASVMGIDMQVTLDSVAGTAKGNFTIIDNLGVAMNATNTEVVCQPFLVQKLIGHFTNSKVFR